MSFWTYMLRCADGSYYVGHTEDLEGRIGAHQAGTLSGYTENRRPVSLVWSQEFPTREEALAAERQIKGWTRAKKEALIAGDWEALHLLAMRSPVLRDEASASSASPQDERRRGHSPTAVRAEEALSEAEAPSRSTSKRKGGRSPATVRAEEVLSEVEVPSRSSESPAPPIIVLVRPQLGENIGKAARAMLNFGLTEMRLVAPRDGWPNPAAGPAASGADIVLERARVFGSVQDAIADCPTVYASTVRRRDVVTPVLSPEAMAEAVRKSATPSAILFGPERSGLATEDVALANAIVTVPINPEFASLNLAQAVILLAYEWSKGSALAVPPEKELEAPAPHGELEGLVRQLEQSLDEKGYFHPPSRTRATMNTLWTIFTKAGWSSREVKAVRGVIRALSEPRRRRG